METDKKTIAVIGAAVAVVSAIVAIGTFGFSLLEGAQDTRREGVEIKTELIDRVTIETTDTIVNGRQIVAGNLGQAAGRPTGQVEQDAYLDAKKTWFRVRFSVAATVATTYSDDAPASEWDDFAGAVTEFLSLSLPKIEPEDQREAAEGLLKYFGAEAAAESKPLVTANPEGMAFKHAYFHASSVLFDRLDELAERLGSADLELY
jgi:hypothetical protein